MPIVDATAALQYDPLTTLSRSSLPALPDITDWSWELENRGNVKTSDVGLRMGVRTVRTGCAGRTVDIMEPSAGITSERPVSDACTDWSSMLNCLVDMDSSGTGGYLRFRLPR